MRRSFDNFALVDNGLANNKNIVPYLNFTEEDPFGTPVQNLPPLDYSTTYVPPLNPNIPPPTTNMDVLQTYTAGQKTESGGFLSSFTAQELNTLGQTVGALTATLLQIRQQSQLAQTEQERQALQAQALDIERQRIEAMNKLADAQRNAGVPVTAGQGLSTGAIVGIVAGSVLVLGLIMFLAFRQK